MARLHRRLTASNDFAGGPRWIPDLSRDQKRLSRDQKRLSIRLKGPRARVKVLLYRLKFPRTRLRCQPTRLKLHVCNERLDMPVFRLVRSNSNRLLLSGLHSLPLSSLTGISRPTPSEILPRHLRRLSPPKRIRFALSSSTVSSGSVSDDLLLL